MVKFVKGYCILLTTCKARQQWEYCLGSMRFDPQLQYHGIRSGWQLKDYNTVDDNPMSSAADAHRWLIAGCCRRHEAGCAQALGAARHLHSTFEERST